MYCKQLLSETLSAEQDVKQQTTQLLQTCSNGHCEFHFLSLCFTLTLFCSTSIFSFPSSISCSAQGTSVKLGKTRRREKNREKKNDGVHITGAVSHSGGAGGSMHPSLRLVISTLFYSRHLISFILKWVIETKFCILCILCQLCGIWNV